jgi:tRNA (guanine37-N1)-methyltransferase
MRIDVVTGFPKILSSPLQESMIRRAREAGVVEIVVHDLRDYTTDRHKTIDDTPYGGGPGMVLKPEPVFACLDHLSEERECDEVVYLSADGERLTQRVSIELSLKKNLVLLCGHYKGVDERIRETLVTREVSIGDYVLTGGELPALVLLDSVVRLLPGVLHDGESLLDDSFQNGLLGSPCYTRPSEFRGMKVPEVLLSGNHSEILEWRQRQQHERTARRRKDMLKYQ